MLGQRCVAGVICTQPAPVANVLTSLFRHDLQKHNYSNTLRNTRNEDRAFLGSLRVPPGLMTSKDASASGIAYLRQIDLVLLLSGQRDG